MGLQREVSTAATQKVQPIAHKLKERNSTICQIPNPFFDDPSVTTVWTMLLCFPLTRGLYRNIHSLVKLEGVEQARCHCGEKTNA